MLILLLAPTGASLTEIICTVVVWVPVNAPPDPCFPVLPSLAVQTSATWSGKTLALSR